VLKMSAFAPIGTFYGLNRPQLSRLVTKLELCVLTGTRGSTELQPSDFRLELQLPTSSIRGFCSYAAGWGAYPNRVNGEALPLAHYGAHPWICRPLLIYATG
jgi:hypothetical protein